MNKAEVTIKNRFYNWLNKLLNDNSYQKQSSHEMVNTLRQIVLQTLIDLIQLISGQLTVKDVYIIFNKYREYELNHDGFSHLELEGTDIHKNLRLLIAHASKRSEINALLSIINSLRPDLHPYLRGVDYSAFQIANKNVLDAKAWNEVWQIIAEAKEIDIKTLNLDLNVGVREVIDYLVEAWNGPQLLEERLRFKEAEKLHLSVRPSSLEKSIKPSPLPSTRIEIEDSQDVTLADGDIFKINNLVINKLIIDPSYSSTQVDSVITEKKDVSANKNVLAQYLSRVVLEYDKPNWSSIQSNTFRTNKIRLRHIYVKLSTQVALGEPDHEAQKEEEIDRILTIPQALRDSNKKLVLLGDPGAGKTTVLRYLALVYADALRTKTNEGLVSKELGLDEDGLIPIFISGSSFGAWLKSIKYSTPERLIEYIRFSLREMGLLDAAIEIEESLKRGNCIILLDGLDEVSNPSVKEKVIRIIDNFVKDERYKDNRFVVSSRVLGYKDNSRLKTDFFEARIRPFDIDDIRQFVNNYCIHIAIKKVADKQNFAYLQANKGSFQREVPEARITAVRLMGKILGNPALLNIATNPLLLTIVCIVFHAPLEKGSGQNIPDRKIDLLQRCTKVLIEIWPRSRDLTGNAQKDFETYYEQEEWGEHKNQLLKIIAYQMQKTGRYVLSHRQMRTLVNNYLIETYKRAKIDRLRSLFFAETEAILSCRQLNEFSFVHPIFREYLAAAQIAQLESRSVKIIMNYVNDPSWHEVLVYTISLMAEQLNNPSLAAEIILQMSTIEDLPRQYMRLQTATESLIEIGESSDKNIQFANVHTKKQLIYAIQEEELQLRKRIKLANLLGYLGDPRVDPNKAPEMVMVNAGNVKLGKEGAEFEQFMPVYWISKYLITNEQFSKFIQDNPKFMPEHWIREGYPSIYPTHPVVDIPWNICIEFCNWLTRLYNHHYRLPSANEWEVAAGWHPEKKIMYRYPWEGDWDHNKCNSRLTNIGTTTTPVGLFYSGRSYYNVFDLVGNVWEWTSTPWTDNDKRFILTQDFSQMKIVEVVIRGGSFSGIDLSQFSVQNCQRYPVNGFGGYFVHRNIGFRVAYIT